MAVPVRQKKADPKAGSMNHSSPPSRMICQGTSLFRHRFPQSRSRLKNSRAVWTSGVSTACSQSGASSRQRARNWPMKRPFHCRYSCHWRRSRSASEDGGAVADTGCPTDVREGMESPAA